MNIVELTSNTLAVKIYSKAKINYFVLAILIILTFCLLTYNLVCFLDNGTLLNFKTIFSMLIIGLLCIIIMFNLVNLSREKTLLFDKSSSSFSIKESNLLNTKTVADSIDFDDIVDIKIEDRQIGGSSLHGRKGYYVRLVLTSGISPIITSSYIANDINNKLSSFSVERKDIEEVIEVIRNFVGITK